MHPVFIQATYYGILMCITIGMIGVIQKGFFWKYIKVRMSFGKFILVKVREINRDLFAVGRIEEGFLIYKANKEEARLSLKDKKPFYRSLAITWIDVDSEKGAVMESDYTAVDGFDSVKHNNLYLRALYKPALNDNKDKMIMGILIIIGIGVAICLLLTWQTYANILTMTASGTGGVIIPGVI